MIRAVSCDVKRIVMEHVVDLEAKMHSLRDMADTLRNLATYCPDNGEPDCPIIQDLAQSGILILFRWRLCPSAPEC